MRLGIATGKGHAAMIYQRFGRWWGLFSLVDLELVNFLTLVTEFAAIDLALNKLGVDPRIGVPMVAAGLVLIGGDWQLSPVGAHRGVPLPAGPCMVCDRVPVAPAGRADRARVAGPRRCLRAG